VQETGVSDTLERHQISATTPKFSAEFLFFQGPYFSPRKAHHVLCYPTCERRGAMDVERFVNDQNIERFKKLANAATTEVERKILFSLLAKEQVKFIELQTIRTPDT
jgi:hypothetical protein